MKSLRISLIMALGLVLAVGMVACSSSPGINIDFEKRSVNGISVKASTAKDVQNKFGVPDKTTSTANEFFYPKDGIIFKFQLSSKIRYIYCILNPMLVSKWSEYSDAEKKKISTMPMRNNLIKKYTKKYFKDKIGEPRLEHIINMDGLGDVTELDYNWVSVLFKDDKPFGIFFH